MSCTLVVRKIPKQTKEWCFKLGLRDVLHERYYDHMDVSAIPFLKCLEFNASAEDKKQLRQIIDALEDGFKITMQMEC